LLVSDDIKKLLCILFVLISFSAFAVEKKLIFLIRFLIVLKQMEKPSL